MQNNSIDSESSLAWTFRPNIGIVHPMSCKKCHSYVSHLMAAKQIDDPSLKGALSEREFRISSAFLDGVREGRELQDEHDAALLTRCREERDQTVKKLELNQQLLDAAKSELALLRDEVLALRTALFYEKPQRKTPGKSLGSFSGGSDSSGLERLVVGSSDYSEDLDHLSTPSSRAADEDDGLSPVEDWDVEISDEDQGTHYVAGKAIASSSSQHPISQPTVWKSISFQPSSSVPPHLPSSPKPITSISRLQALMKSAHSGNELALLRVRAFCATAHQTPRDQRTELQRYSLIHWRNKPPAYYSPRPPPTEDINVEIYVDASAWGIGFVMDDKWLAWKFSDSVCLKGKLLDISWAEMLAVELGLWTTVHWALWQTGLRCSFSILVRSDNAGVIRAIEKQSANHPLQQEVLSRIIDLVDEYDIQLSMKWVPSLENLADNPSRGAPGLNATLLSYVPPLPQYLEDILIPITDFS